MKTKTGLVALGLFALAGVNIVNCGGSSDDSSSSTSTSGKGGTKSTAGSSSTGGGTSTAGSSSGGSATGTAGSAASTAGNSSTGGTPGTAGNTGTAGRNNQGGANDNPGAGGADNAPGCPAAMPADGSMCTQMNQVRGGCDYGDMNCRCARANGGMRTWQCDGAIGAGGAPGGFGQATCPANAKDGDDCTGFGQCTGQPTCFCFQGNTNCQ